MELKNKYLFGFGIGLIVSLLSIVFIVPMKFNFAEKLPEYCFKADPNIYHNTPLPPLDKELNMTKMAGGRTWVARKLSNALKFSSDNYEEHMQLIKSDFTIDGWKTFEKALADSGVRELLKTPPKISFHVETIGMPIPSFKDTYKGKYRRIYKVPFLLSYEYDQKVKTKELLFIIIIDRVEAHENIQGYQISTVKSKRFLTKARGGPIYY